MLRGGCGQRDWDLFECSKCFLPISSSFLVAIWGRAGTVNEDAKFCQYSFKDYWSHTEVEKGNWSKINAHSTWLHICKCSLFIIIFADFIFHSAIPLEINVEYAVFVCVCVSMCACDPAELWRFWIHSARASRWRWHHRAVSRACPLPATVRAGWECHSQTESWNCTYLPAQIRPKQLQVQWDFTYSRLSGLQGGASTTWARWTWHATSLRASWSPSNKPTWMSALRRSCCSSWWAEMEMYLKVPRYAHVQIHTFYFGCLKENIYML